MKIKAFELVSKPQIEYRFEELREDIKGRLSKYDNLVVTPETKGEVKKLKSEINKEFKFWEEKRKEIKKAINEPYKEFEELYKEHVSSLYTSTINSLDVQIKDIESEELTKKTKQIEDYFYKQARNIPVLDWLRFDMANIKVNMSKSLKSLKLECTTFIDSVCDDLGAIQTMAHSNEIEAHYRTTLNLNESIQAINKLKEAEETIKQKREEAKKREAEVQEVVAQKPVEVPKKAESLVVEDLREEPKEAPKGEKKYKVTFEVTGNAEEMKALVQFLGDNNYKRSLINKEEL